MRSLSICLAVFGMALNVSGAGAQPNGPQNEDYVVDFFKVYDVSDVPIGQQVTLKAAYDAEPLPAIVDQLTRFANRASIDDEPFKDANAHFKWYQLKQQQREPRRVVRVRNRFGPQRLTLGRPVALLAPAERIAEGSAAPKRLDHYKVYEVLQGKCTPQIDKKAWLRDQYVDEKDVLVRDPLYVAVPVEVRYDDQTYPIQNPNDYLVLYNIPSCPANFGIWRAKDEFGTHDVASGQRVLLIAPSRLQFIPPPDDLDWFRFYDIDPIAAEEDFELKSRFDNRSAEARTYGLTRFGDSTGVDGKPVIDEHANLTWYRFRQEQFEPVRTVRIWNEFGEQQLWLGGAKYLLVPAENKYGDSQFPDDLDYYKCFTVLRSCATHGRRLRLKDDFEEQVDVNVGQPIVFAVPALVGGAEDLEKLKKTRRYLTIYGITKKDFSEKEMKADVEDPFSSNDVRIRRSYLLGVPTLRFEIFPPLREEVKAGPAGGNAT